MIENLVNHPTFSDLAPHIVEKFVEYHRKNPAIYEQFKKFAYLARNRWKHFGARMLLERVRWETTVAGDGDFKINNNYHPCYARLLMIEDLSFRNFFETRRTPGTVEEK